MDSTIWVMIIVISVLVFILTLITSVNKLHKKLIEKPYNKIEEKEEKNRLNN